MEANMRNLLALAQTNKLLSQQKVYVQEVYHIMKSLSDKSHGTGDGSQAFGTDLMVLCAEEAYQCGELDAACSCLRMFFATSPPADQFLCRAYLCQAQLSAPASSDNLDDFSNSIKYILKAISIATSKPRYHYLAYNASVIYWQFCRPFLKPQYRRQLVKSLHQIVKALDEVDDPDHDWRAELKIALLECYVVEGSAVKAPGVAELALASLRFVQKQAPQHYVRMFGLIANNQLCDPAKLQGEAKTSKLLGTFAKICALKREVESNDASTNVEESIEKILADLSAPQPTKTTDAAKKSADLDTAMGLDRSHLLLELGRLCVSRGLVELAEQCIAAIQAQPAKERSDKAFACELELLQCELTVASQNVAGDFYRKSAVEVRVQAIQRCEEAILTAVRHCKPSLIQAACATQWNLCLPLLQPNLRHLVKRALYTAADALENINSLLLDLRCQLHIELYKCEEDKEQLTVAIEHIKKAMNLDDRNVYKSRLAVALRRLELRTELYKPPERGEDVAAMIIEQAGRSSLGTLRMKRSLLVKAGQALAPDAFNLILESESSDDSSPVKDILLQVKQLGDKARLYVSSMRKTAGHLRRLGSENDKERAQLWGDLCKTARRQQVWDVCRVAAAFCLLYDDNRWQPTADANSSSTATVERKQSTNPAGDGTLQPSAAKLSAVSPSPPSGLGRGPSPPSGLGRGPSPASSQQAGASPAPTLSTLPGRSSGVSMESAATGSTDVSDQLHKKDLVRLMAEVNFIYGEALIQLLRSEGVELCNLPQPPVDHRKHPKGHKVLVVEELPDWMEYIKWIQSISADALSKFVRAAQLGITLQEQWIVGSAAAYVWNYSNHLIDQNRHSEILPSLQSLLEALKVNGHEKNTNLLVAICNAIALGCIQPFLPSATALHKTSSATESAAEDKSAKHGSPKEKAGGKAGAAAKAKAATTGFTVSADAMPLFKSALEVCEFALTVTNGSVASDVVPIADRLPLLQTWVKLKHCLQSNIGKSLGTSDETNADGQNAMTRAIVGVELLCAEKLLDFKDSGIPSITQGADLISAVAEWEDKLVELQLWTRLASCALTATDHANVTRCAGQALLFDASKLQKKSPLYAASQQLLSYASNVLGQSLLATGHGCNRHAAMSCFVDGARYASNINDYELVMSNVRQFWNAFLPLMSHSDERQRTRDDLLALLQCLTKTTDKNKFKKADEEENKETKPAAPLPQPPNAAPVATASGPGAGNTAASGQVVHLVDKPTVVLPAAPKVNSLDEDMSLRASLYGVLFQSYADGGDWEMALKAMDQAILDMPRTNHRLLIFKHMVVVKSALGMDVTGTVQRFREESCEYIAGVWRRVALSSPKLREQLLAYQNAIELLSGATEAPSGPDKEWVKVGFLQEFAEWLYCNELPLQDAVDLLHWAVDILLNMTFDLPAWLEAVKADVEKPKDKKKSVSNTGSPARKKPQQSGETLKLVPSAVPSQLAAKLSAAEYYEDKLSANVLATETAERGLVIGMILHSPPATFDDLCDVRQLDHLFVAFSLLAELSGTDSPAYIDYCLSAYSVVAQLWQVSIGNVGGALKEMAKQPPPVEGKSGKNSPRKDGDKKPAAGKKKKEEEVKPKVERKFVAVDALPSNVEEWSTYEVPDEALHAFKHDLMSSTIGITVKTIQKPTLTIWYLDSMVKKLRQLGFGHLALPLLSLSEFIARDIINNASLLSCVHLQALEVCTELNIKTGIDYHDQMARFKINELDQAKCREEIIAWRNRQAHIVNENDTQSASKQVKESTARHLFPQLGPVNVQLVWINMAEIFIRNAVYGPALEFLNETRQAALAFGNKWLLSRTLQLLAQLSFHEAQYTEAINLCHSAQETLGGDEMFWYEMVTVVVDSTLRIETQKYTDRYAEARCILENALKVFVELEVARPTKTGILGFIVGKLTAKLGSLEVELASTSVEMDIDKKTTLLLSACEKFEPSALRLMQAGRRRDAVTVMREHAQQLSSLASLTAEPETKHRFYLEAMKMMEKCVGVAEELLAEVHTYGHVDDLQLSEVSLPVQRECVDMKLAYADILLTMYRFHVDDERQKKVEKLHLPSVLQTLDDITYEEPSYEGTEKEWHNIASQLSSMILAQVSAAHGLCGEIHDLTARTLCSMGKCYQILSLHCNPDHPMQWSLYDMDLVPSSGQVLAVASHSHSIEGLEEEEGQDSDRIPKDFDKHAPVVAQLKLSLETSHQYLMQATECLAQAVNIALNNQLKSITAECSLALAECIGQFDPGLSSQYLALYQSCTASVYLENLLLRTLNDPTLSRSAALFRQLETLRSDNITTNAVNGPTFTAVTETLQEESKAYSALAVLPQHLDLLKEFPPNFTLVILQHSPDKSYLYGAILDKPKLSVGSGVAGGGPVKAAKSTGSGPPQAQSKARVVRAETSADILAGLLSRWKAFKDDIMQVYVRCEFQCSILAQNKKLFAGIDASTVGQSSVSEQLTAEEQAYQEARLQEQFLRLLEEMETYLQPITAEIDNLIRPAATVAHIASTASATMKLHAPKVEDQPTATDMVVVLLADSDLLQLPLEALRCLRAECIDAVTRDVSLQLLHHRLTAEVPVAPTSPGKKKRAWPKGLSWSTFKNSCSTVGVW